MTKNHRFVVCHNLLELVKIAKSDREGRVYWDQWMQTVKRLENEETRTG